MATRQQWQDFKDATKVWQDDQDAYMVAVETLLYAHRTDSMSTEIGGTGSNPEPPKNPPPHPPG